MVLDQVSENPMSRGPCLLHSVPLSETTLYIVVYTEARSRVPSGQRDALSVPAIRGQ